MLKLFKRLAIFLSLFFKPKTIFGCIGILPVTERSFKDYFPVQFQDQLPFPNSSPRSIRDGRSWVSSPTSLIVMGHLLEVPNGLVSGSGYVFDESGNLINGASHRFSRKIKRGLVCHPYRIFPAIKLMQGSVGAITASNQDAYFHWLFDLLPRLKMLEDMGLKPDKYYMQYRYRFQRETLDLLEFISSQQIINCDDFPLLSATRLIVPCHEVMDGREFPQWVVHFLRDSFLPKRGASVPSSKKRLFVSRADALFRRILNELELIPVFEEYGFTLVKLEKLSFQDQVSLFKDAEAVVLPHGSGLANLVFCSEGTKVIELFPNQMVDLSFRLSTAVGLDYFFLSARQGDSRICEGTSHSGNIPYDFIIHTKDLIDTLKLAKIKPLPKVKETAPRSLVKHKLEPEYVQRPALGIK